MYVAVTKDDALLIWDPLKQRMCLKHSIGVKSDVAYASMSLILQNNELRKPSNGCKDGVNMYLRIITSWRQSLPLLSWSAGRQIRCLNRNSDRESAQDEPS